MIVSITKEQLEMLRFNKLKEQDEDLERQVNAAISLADEAYYEEKDEEKAKKYQSKAIEITLKRFELIKEMMKFIQ